MNLEVITRIKLEKTHTEAKQHAIKQSVGQWGNRKIPRDKRKREHDNPKPTGHSTAASL